MFATAALIFVFCVCPCAQYPVEAALDRVRRMLAEEVTAVEWRARRARKHAQLVEALRAADLPLPGPADPEMSRIVDDATEDPKRGGDDLSGCQVCACALYRVAANQSLRCPQGIKS